MKLYECELLPLDMILDVMEMSCSTFFQVQKLWCETGDVISHKASLQGHLRALNYDDVQCLLVLIKQNLDYFLDELLYLLKKNQFISVHYTTIHHALEWAGVSQKKTQENCIWTKWTLMCGLHWSHGKIWSRRAGIPRWSTQGWKDFEQRIWKVKEGSVSCKEGKVCSRQMYIHRSIALVGWCCCLQICKRVNDKGVVLGMAGIQCGE